MITTEPVVGFAQYVRDQRVPLLRFAAVLTGDVDLAEEIVADVLTKAFERWADIGAVDHPHAYVRRMITNHYISWRRKWGRLRPQARDDIFDRPVPDISAQHADRDDVLTRLATLPPRQRAALVLRFYEGLSMDEIAEAMNCNAGTVRSHVSRGLAALRVQLTHDLDTPEGTSDHA